MIRKTTEQIRQQLLLDGAKERKLKEKRCRFCKAPFKPVRPLQVVCGYICGMKLENVRIAKKEGKEWNLRKRELKEKTLTHKDYIKLLQIVFNTFIRLRDELRPCVSCGVSTCEEFHAGHYIATTHSFLRFNEGNVWKQCSRCNTHLRGNPIPYREELIKRIGIKSVEKLEDDRHKKLELSIPEIKEKIVFYKAKIKGLKRNN